MTRNVKTIGLAMALILMLCMMVAPSASAVGKFTAASYPQHLVGTSVEEGSRFTLSSNYFLCPNDSQTSVLSASSSHLTVTPSFGTCSTNAGGENPATIHGNECLFTYKLTGTGAADESTGAMVVSCPNKPLEYRHTTTCNVTIPSQEGVGTVTYTNLTASKDVLFEGQISLSGLMHGSCSFGFTLGVTMVHDMNTTVQASSGAAFHVG